MIDLTSEDFSCQGFSYITILFVLSIFPAAHSLRYGCMHTLLNWNSSLQFVN